MAAEYWKIFPSSSSSSLLSSRELVGSNAYSKKSKKMKTPKGHIVVYVGEEMRRNVVPIRCLNNNPQFQQLLEEAAEAYGFHSNGSGIILPCDEATFHRVMINFEGQ